MALASEGTQTRFGCMWKRDVGDAVSLGRTYVTHMGFLPRDLPSLWGESLLSHGLQKIILSCPQSGDRQPMPDSTAWPHPPPQPWYLTLSRGLRCAGLPDSHRWRQGAAGQGRNHLALGVQQQLGGHSLDLQALGWCWGCHAS